MQSGTPVEPDESSLVALGAPGVVLACAMGVAVVVAWMVWSILDILDFRRVKALAKMFCGIKSVPKRPFDRTGRAQSDLDNAQIDGPVFLKGASLIVQTADCRPQIVI